MSLAAECTTHQLRSGSTITGTLRGHVAGWLAAFSDLQVTMEHMLAEGDLVFTSTPWRGRFWAHGPEYVRRVVSIRSMVIHRIVDGKICEDWVRAERLGLQELGLAPVAADMLAEAARSKHFLRAIRRVGRSRRSSGTGLVQLWIPPPPVDDTLIPTRELRNVVETPFDFRAPHLIVERIEAEDARTRLC